MLWRVYGKVNVCERTGLIFHTYFKTKKEALEYMKTIEGAVLEKKLAYSWVKVVG